MGLRELKKARTRQAVQRAALRLFEEQGYEATTVEQIALAAEISTATFYRYYCDKEDVVLGDDDRGLAEEVLAQRDPGETLPEMIGALFSRMAEQLESRRDSVLVRLRLMSQIPSLQARRWASRQAMIDLLAHLLAPRVGVQPDDHELRLAITVALAAESETVLHWARIGGAEPLGELLSGALAQVEPVLSAWQCRPPAGESAA